MFRSFESALPDSVSACVESYPVDRLLTYAEHEETVSASLPIDREFAILAESYSGPIALRIAARKPPGLRALVLVATFAEAPRRWPPAGVSLLARFLFGVPIPSLLIRNFLLGPHATAAAIAEFRKAISAVRPQVLAARLADILRVNVRKELESCPCPILYIAAANDKLVQARASERIRGLRPDVEFAALEGPHLLLQSNPGPAAARIIEFLNRVMRNEQEASS